MTNAALKGTSGAILQIPLTLNAEPGSYDITISNVTATEQGTNRTLKWPGGTSTLTITGGQTPPSDLQNILVLRDTAVKTGTKFDLPIYLTNKDAINSIGGVITLPQGMEIEKKKNGKYNFLLNDERASADDAFSVSSQVQADGSVKFLIVSTDGTDIAGNDGVIMYVPVVVGDELEGDYTIRITGIQMSDADAKLIDSPDVEATITVEQYTLGDVDNDGQIAPNDITMLIKAYLGVAPDGFVLKAGDINENGYIDPSDVTAIIKLYLNNGMAGAPKKMTNGEVKKAPAANAPQTDNVLTIDNITAEAGTTVNIPVVLKNTAVINSIGGVITLPEGMEIEKKKNGKYNFKLNEDRASVDDAFSVSSQEQADGSVKFLIVSTDGTDISGNDGVIMTVPVVIGKGLSGSHSLKMTSVQMSDADAKLIDCPDVEATIALGGDATGIENVGVLTQGQPLQQTTYNLSGQRVNDNAKGIVVRNGRKVFVKP